MALSPAAPAATSTTTAAAAAATRATVTREASEQVDYGRWILFSLMHTGTGSSGAVGAASAARSL